MIISIIISLSYIWISYYNSGKIAIASVGARKVARDRVTPVSMGCPWILGRNSQRKGWPTGRAKEKGRRENPALSFSVPLNSSYFLFMR